MAEFKLSRAVEGHRNDVKCLTAFPGSIVSGSRDETVKFWTLRGSEYTESLSLPQSLVVNSLALYRPVDGGAWIVFAGRKDGSIGAFSAGSSDPVAVLHEHKSNVCTLFVDAEQKVLMSGSWDANAIVWPIDQLASGSFNALGLVGHTMSVWSVSTVPNMPDHYLTGSADKTIRFWHHDNQLRSFHGHSDVVRSILTLSSSNFLTCSNDSTIRLWDLTTGECLAKYSSLSGEYLYRLVVTN
uniref:Uncharacterized protein n=1 Tax=Plectus sambesii TaxID=2011161 RepID=A0A914WVW9_9BILA